MKTSSKKKEKSRMGKERGSAEATTGSWERSHQERKGNDYMLNGRPEFFVRISSGREGRKSGFHARAR